MHEKMTTEAEDAGNKLAQAAMTKTDVARIWRKVYGGTRFDESALIFAAEVAEFVEKAVSERCAQYLVTQANGCSVSGQDRAVLENTAAALRLLGPAAIPQKQR